MQLPLSSERLTQGTHKVSSALMCPHQPERCQPGDYVEVTLPDFPETEALNGRHHATYKIAVTPDHEPSGFPVLYLPQLSDSILIWANDTAISPDRNSPEELHHNWNRPHYAPFPSDVFNDRDVIFTIYLQSNEFHRVSLYPLYIGNGETLEFASKIRLFYRVGTVRVAYTMAALGGIALLCLWFTRRHDQAYLLLAAVALAACIVAGNMVIPNALDQIPYWWAIWNSALVWLFYGILHFSVLIYEFDHPRMMRGLFWICIFSTGALIAMPEAHFRTASQLVGLFCGAMGLCALACHILSWPGARGWQRFHVPVLALAGGAAIAEYVYAHVDPMLAKTHRANLAFLILFGALFLALIGHLARTLTQYDALTRSMQGTIERKTAELEKVQERVLEAEKANALAEERRRIMLDLHDGVGGQLVNVLSYLNCNDAADPIVHTSLEEALRDMALIIDSLEVVDDVAVMLGALRERMEPLLQRHGIQVHWDVAGDPDLSDQPSKTALNIVRIAQESLTNAIKHSNCQNIFVTIAPAFITIRDDGRGFDPDKAGRLAGFNSGLGLKGMRQRAQENNLELSVRSSDQGTLVSVEFSKPSAPNHSAAVKDHAI
ncbi:sensor histidine kinase [Thalassococcus sp. S3]|uniref:sensor histidine kinase n=1 Tax=Thalassococcus sp. S3 TaxID=2017482 RepID=UPI0013EE79F4|nr:ATP-binding protein [Thalassococcus sp. S3]